MALVFLNRRFVGFWPECLRSAKLLLARAIDSAQKRPVPLATRIRSFTVLSQFVAAVAAAAPLGHQKLPLEPPSNQKTTPKLYIQLRFRQQVARQLSPYKAAYKALRRRLRSTPLHFFNTTSDERRNFLRLSDGTDVCFISHVAFS
jgi:hypothetical protein